MASGNLLNWFFVISLTVRQGDSLHPSRSILLLDDEDLTLPFIHGSGDGSEANAVGEIQGDSILLTVDGANAMWINEHDGSGSGKKGIDEAMYIDDEEVVASGGWRDRFDEPDDLLFMPDKALDTAEQEDSSGLLLDLPTGQTDEISTGTESSNRNNTGHISNTMEVTSLAMNFRPCSSISNPCKVHERCVASGSTTICQRDDSGKSLADLCQSQPCMNNGICHNGNDGNFRCECRKGFAGSRCDQEDPCLPNPCPGDCTCTTSSQHLPDYLCESPRGLGGKNCDIPVPEVNCNDDKIFINVSRMFLEDFESAYGSQRLFVSNVPTFDTANDDNSCQVQKSVADWQLIIPAPFTRCGTTRSRGENGSNHEIVRNQLWVQGTQMNVTKALLQAQFECRYKAVYIPVNRTTGETRGTKSGPIVELCKVKSCPNSCPKEYYADAKTEFGIDDTIYMTVSDESLSEGEILSIQNVAFSCEKDVFEDVRSGCKINPELFVESTVGSVSCLSVRMPRAISCSTAFLHVEVASCPAADVEMCVHNATILRCTGTYSRRLKRSAKPYAKGVAAFNTRYERVGETTVKLFSDLMEVRRVSSSSDGEGSGRSKKIALFVSASIGILISVAVISSMFFGKTNSSIKVSI